MVWGGEGVKTTAFVPTTSKKEFLEKLRRCYEEVAVALTL